MKYEQLQIGKSFRFTPTTKDYGRAEFCICPIIKYGKIKEIYLIAMQQPDDGKNYHIVIDDSLKIHTISITDFTNSPNPPKMWRSTWCKDHKTFSNIWYVASHSNKITVRQHFGDTIGLYFEFESEKEIAK